MPRYCTILPHAPLPCAAIMACRGIAPFYPTLPSLVLLLCHAEVLHHSTPRSSPLCCYYGMPRYCSILPHAPLPCAAIMPCRGIAPFYPTLLSLVLLLCHAEVLHHSTTRSSPLCCYYAMPRYCTILPHAPLLVLLLCHAEVLHHSTTRSSPLCCYYAMPRYCTILPHAPLPCAAIMACRGIAPFYPTLLSLVLLVCHAEVLHHSTHAPPVCCYYGMPRYCTILPHAPLPCAAIMQCRGIAPFYPTLLSLVLLLCHAEVLQHSTPRSSPVCCYYAMPRYCTILPHAPLPCAAIMPCRGIAPFYPTLLSLVLLLWHAEVLLHSTPRSSPVCCYYAMPRYCTILPHAPLPCTAIMPCRCIAPFYPTLLSHVLLLCHADVLPHSTPRSSPLCCYYAMSMNCTILPHAPLPCAASMPCRCIAPFYPTLLSLVLLLWHAEVLHHSTPRSSPLCCYYDMPRYCTILPHAPLPCVAIMACRGIAPFYPTLLSLVLLLWHAEVLHHSTPRSPPLCCYYAMPRYCTILPHAPLPCAAIMACRGIAPFYPTLLSRVLLLCHAEVLHHSTPRSSPLYCYYAMPRYCTILPHAPLPCAAIMPCRGIAPFYPTLLSLCCYYAMPRYCTILPHAPLPCAAIMPCRGIAPFYLTLLSLVLLLWHAEVLHHSTPRSSLVLLLCHADVLQHSTPRSSPVCCYYAMPRYCTILPHAPLPCAAIMPCRGIAPFYPTLLSLVLLLWHAEVLLHSTPRSSPVCCYYAMPRYCTILPHAPLPCTAIMPCRCIAPFYPTLLSHVLLLCHADVLPHSTPRSSPLCCYYAMSMNCTILPHAPLRCAASMPCRCIAPFYPTLLSLVLLLWHAEVLHHSTPRSSPLCCYYAMPRYCTILPHAPLPCAAIMACRGIAPFYPTLLSLVLVLCHADVLHHSTPRSSPLCCYYGMLRYCTILPHAPLPCAAIMPCRCIAPFYPTLLSIVLLLCHAEVSHHSTPRSSPLCCYYAMSRYCTILPHAPLPCAAIMACRGIASFYPTHLSRVLLLCHADVLHHSTPRSSRVLLLCHVELLHHSTPRSSRVLLLCHAEVLHHSTPRSSPLCCYYAMPRYCTILPHAPLPCAAIMPCRCIAPFYPTLLSIVLLLCHAEVSHHSTPRSSPLCCYYAMSRYCTILPHAPLPCAAIMACRGIASFYPTHLSRVLLLCHADVLHHSTPRSSRVLLLCHVELLHHSTPRSSRVLLLCHAEVLHHSTPRSSPLCCYYAMPRYCTILPHAPLPCVAIMACRGIAPFYPTLPSLVLLLCHAEVLHHSTPRSSPLCCYYAMPRYCTILPHAPLPCAAIMACRGIASFYPTHLSRVLLLCHADVLHHSTPRSSRVLLLCHVELLHHSTPRSSRVLLLCHAEVLHHSTPRSSPLCCYYAMPRYCTILPHAPLPCVAIMACRGIAPFYPTLLSLVLLLWHAEVLHHSTPRSPPLCCYYAMPRYCTILPHAPLPCAAIMACRGIAPFYPTLLSRVLLLCHAEVLHHSTPRSSPLYCYYAMPRYCTILPHAPLPCAAIMPCRGIAPFYPTLLSLVLLLCHAEVLHHSTTRSSPLCCYYAMPRYCTILPHAPLPCAAIMACRGIAPFYPTLLPCAAIMPCRGIATFYPTLLSRVLLLCNAEVLHHSTTRSSPLCCYYAMPRYCTILPHAPLPCAAIMACRGIAPFYPTLLSRVLLLCHAEVLHHSTPRSSPLYCYYAMPRYCTILPHAPLHCTAIMACRGIAPFYPTLLSIVLLLCHAEVLHHSTSRSSPLCCYYGMPRYCTILPHAPPLCCYYAMPRYCTILPHAPLPCAAIMQCQGIAPFYHTLLSLVLLLCHAEVLHHSTSRSSPLCCYYAMPRYCTILPMLHPCVAIMACRGIAPFYPTLLPCAAIMPCRAIAPFYPTLLSLVLLLWHAEVLHHSTPRSSPLCCYYAMPRYCTILPHAPLPCAAIMACRGIAPFYPTLLPCAAIMPCRGIAPFYPTLLSRVLLLCNVEVLHHSTTRSSPLCCYYAMPRYCTILPHTPLPCAAIMPCRGIAPFYPCSTRVLLLWHAEVLHHSTPRSSRVLLLCHAELLHHSPHAPLPCAVIMACRGIAPFYPTLLSIVLLLWHAEVLHHSTPRSSPLCCYYAMPRYCTILPHAPLPCAAVMPCRGIAPFYPTLLPCAAIMPCRAIAPFYPTLLSLVLLLWHAEVLHHSTPSSSRVLLVWHAEVLHHSTPRSSPLCCYYGMPRYCTILPHAPLPCAAIMACRGIAPFYPTLLSLVLLLWHAEVLHHSTPRSSPLCC